MWYLFSGGISVGAWTLDVLEKMTKLENKIENKIE